MSDLKILLCDDSLLIRKKLKNALIEKGYSQVFEASDGEEALAVFEAEQPDLTLLDIVMPKKDGIQALHEMKQMNSAAHVVIASSVGTQANLIQAIKYGANDFLQKPITIDAVLNVINKMSHVERGEG
jgi:two-component system chemotaxis response regulator CheY